MALEDLLIGGTLVGGVLAVLLLVLLILAPIGIWFALAKLAKVHDRWAQALDAHMAEHTEAVKMVADALRLQGHTQAQARAAEDLARVS